jgi:hypothetical protein
MSYSSHPSAPMDRPAALRYLWQAYQMPGINAADLLDRARESATGMASLPRAGEYTVWATHMSTLGGQFIIERE